MNRFLNGRLLLLFTSLIFLAVACKTDPQPPPPPPAPKNTAKVNIPRFDRDSAYAFVAKQVDFGPRVPNSEGHRQARQWLVEKMKGYGADVIEQNFDAEAYDGTILKSTNIISQFNPSASKRILLAAHWDTRHIADSPLNTERRDEPILGADDGGSGVGVLLEIARQLQANPIDMGVDIIFFDAEDYGVDADTPEEANAESWALGSQHWAKNIHRPNYRPKYGILLDMVGHKNAVFGREYFSMQVAPRLMDEIWKLADQMGYGNRFINKDIGAVTDDHLYVIQYAKIPMIDIIYKQPDGEQGFGTHWHTHNDNMDIIDKRVLRSVGQVVLAVIYKEANDDFM